MFYKIACFLAVAVSLTACTGAPSVRETPARVVHDGLGREVRLPERVERAVSLAPSITEMVFAAGAGNRLAGVTAFCDFPADARAIEKIGDTQIPNIEHVAALRPQVVLVSTASQLEAFTDVLQRQGIAVYVLDVKGIGDVAAGLRTLGQIFGTEQEAEKAAASFEARIEAAEAALAGREVVPVFVQISREPLFTIGRDSFVTEAVRLAGGASITAEIPTAYPTLSKETALAMDPPVIVLSDSGDNREPNEVFKASQAVREGRVFKINADIISRPGPRLADAVEQMAAMLKGKEKVD